MSEDLDPTSTSDTHVGGKKPTVIGGKEAVSLPKADVATPHQPTVIDPSSVPVRKPNTPTVIGHSLRSSVVQEQQSPVVPSQSAPTQSPLVLPPATVSAQQPTVIPGTVRKGLEVNRAELARHAPGASSEVLVLAEKLARGVAIEALTETQCVRWGEPVQKKFGTLTEQSLKLTGDTVIHEGETHIERLYVVLEKFGAALQSGGSTQGLAFWRPRHTLSQQFQRAQGELRQLRDILEPLLQRIVAVEESLAILTGEFDALFVMLTAESIAARYIAEKCMEQCIDNAQLRSVHTLIERSVSLSETAAFAQQGMLLREQAMERIRSLITQIQHGVLNALPVWIESVTLVLRQADPTETDRYALKQGLDAVMRRMYREGK